jgi:uncharacterized membrane protein YhhN
MAIYKKYGGWLFAITLALHCLFIYLEMGELRTATKFLLLPILIIYLLSFPGKISLLVYAGLIFSFSGDLLLSRTGEIFFLFGMLAFIGTHICNSLFFARLQKGKIGKGKEGMIALLVLLVFSYFVFMLIKDNLGNFKLPILLYMFIISLMAFLATGTIQNESIKTTAIRFFIPGAVLFVVSDATLAINKFLVHQTYLDIMVMLTYGLAQYFLVKGFIEVKSGRL